MMSMKRWVRSLLLVGCVSGVALAPFGEAEAALNAYLKLKGQKQGEIKGSAKQKGRENSLRVIAVNHEVVSPRDAASGLPTGKRQHKPISIVVELDRATPQLFAALTQSEILSTVELNVLAPTVKGVEEVIYTVTLKNASISSIKAVSGEDGKLHHELTLTYQKIEWLWREGGVMATDDWVTAKK